MKTKKFQPTIFAVLILLVALLTSGCNLVPLLVGNVPLANSTSEPDLPPVFGPEAARDAGFDYIRFNYAESVSGPNPIWTGGETSSGEAVGNSTFQYLSASWVSWVSYPLVSPDATIYTVKLQNLEAGFSWEGLIDAYGQIATTSVTHIEPETTPEVIGPDPTDLPVMGTLYYRDEAYKIAMEYPADWALSEITAAQDAKVLKLQKSNWIMNISYKFRWDNAKLGGGLPAGDIVDRGWATLLGRAVPKHFVVYEGKDKVMYYGDRFEDLEFYIRLDADLGGGGDYNTVDIPESLQGEVENIVANIIRTGAPIKPPKPTPTPIPPTPTPIPVPCNAANFQADLTIPDGTIFAPGADFTKIWRLKNVGSCSWTTDYDLVFVDGDRMDGKKAVRLPEKIRPGETLDISVQLTSPDHGGEYRGYWMLRSDSGEWFGIGSKANKAFWVDIEVIKPKANYEYDFSLNYCAATWRSEAMRLPCPGQSTSGEGFTVLLMNPELENRKENEPALWVHPNEERYGWLEGTYPTYEVEDGDHFKAWVGCLEGYTKCSLKFYLDYESEDGKVRRLGEWLEVYDNMATTIDLDLSDLAGKDIHFILGVEALTKNVDDAQGFWFVPHIINPD